MTENGLKWHGMAGLAKNSWKWLEMANSGQN